MEHGLPPAAPAPVEAPGVPRGTLLTAPDSLAELLGAGLAELGHPLPDTRVEALAELARLVVRWAPRVNLTAHREAESVARALILDALALGFALPDLHELPLLAEDLPGAPQLVDLGSGAGFPGLPIGLARPELQVLLVESRERAHHFQREALRTLEAANVEAVLGRSEALEPRRAPLVLAQAVAPARTSLGLMAPWVGPGGWMLLPCSSPAPADLEPPPGFVALAPLAYRVPLGGPARALWRARREPGS